MVLLRILVLEIARFEFNRANLVADPIPLAVISYGGITLFVLSLTLKHLFQSASHDSSNN